MTMIGQQELGGMLGWCVFGKRFKPLIDISGCVGLGFWLHADGQLGKFTLVLVDEEGEKWEATVDLDFKGWSYREYSFSQTKEISLHRIEYLIFFFHQLLPSTGARSCYIDHAAAVRELSPSTLSHPTVIFGDQRLEFPATLAAGDWILFRDGKDCGIYDSEMRLKQALQPEGVPILLQPGANSVRFDCDRSRDRSQGAIIRLAMVKPLRLD